MSQDPEQLEALLAEYVEGTLDAEGTRLVETHLAANPSGRTLIERMRSDRNAIRGLPRLTAPADLSEDLRGQLERDLLFNDSPIDTPRTRTFSAPALAVAAMLLVGLGLGTVAYVLLSNRPPQYDVALHDATTDGPTTAPVQEASPMIAEASAGANRSVAAGPTTVTVTRDRDLAAAAQSQAKRSIAGGEAAPLATMAEKAAPLEVTPPAAMAAPGSQRQAAAARPTLELADSEPPANVIHALSERAIDGSRRSIVVVVDQRDALDALALVSRVARTNGTGVEVSDRAAQDALRQMPGGTAQQVESNANLQSQAELESTAKFAAVARGLPPAAAATLLNDLRQIEPSSEVPAFEVPMPAIESTPATDAAIATSSAATTTPARSAAATAPTTTRAATTMRSNAGRLSPGERLRVTLVDPDAFDLRTTHEVTIDPRGDIALPSLERVSAAGTSVEKLRTTIADAYRSANLMRRPIVRVESLDSGATSRDAADLSEPLDVYVVIRKPAAATQPIAEPTSQSTTRPTSVPMR